MYIPTVSFDFDGVIHSYRSGWKGAAVIPDPPVEGIKEVIEQLISDGLCVVICSSRAESFEGQTAIAEWLWCFTPFMFTLVSARSACGSSMTLSLPSMTALSSIIKCLTITHGSVKKC